MIKKIVDWWFTLSTPHYWIMSDWVWPRTDEIKIWSQLGLLWRRVETWFESGRLTVKWKGPPNPFFFSWNVWHGIIIDEWETYQQFFRSEHNKPLKSKAKLQLVKMPQRKSMQTDFFFLGPLGPFSIHVGPTIANTKSKQTLYYSTYSIPTQGNEMRWAGLKAFLRSLVRSDQSKWWIII